MPEASQPWKKSTGGEKSAVNIRDSQMQALGGKEKTVQPCPEKTVLIVEVVNQDTSQTIEGAAVQIEIHGVSPGKRPPPNVQPNPNAPQYTTDRLGQVRREGIDPLHYDVWAWAADHGARMGEVTVVRGETTKLVVAVPTHLIVVAYGWWGTHVTRAFELAAQTKIDELIARNAKKKYRIQNNGLVNTKDWFTKLFQALSAQERQILEFHYFSHSGYEDGPIFSPDQFTKSEVAGLAQLPWAPGASARFYGCNSAYGWFAPAFATEQNVTVFGQPGYTSFSRVETSFDPLTDPTVPPVYQGCYLSKMEAGRRNYNDRDALTYFVSTEITPDVAALLEYLGPGQPPLPMVEIGPGSTRRDAYRYRGVNAPDVYSPAAP